MMLSTVEQVSSDTFGGGRLIECDHMVLLRVKLHTGHEVRTLRNEDQEPLFCGAMPAASSLDDEDIIKSDEGALRL